MVPLLQLLLTWSKQCAACRNTFRQHLHLSCPSLFILCSFSHSFSFPSVSLIPSSHSLQLPAITLSAAALLRSACRREDLYSSDLDSEETGMGDEELWAGRGQLRQEKVSRQQGWDSTCYEVSGVVSRHHLPFAKAQLFFKLLKFDASAFWSPLEFRSGEWKSCLFLTVQTHCSNVSDCVSDWLKWAWLFIDRISELGPTLLAWRKLGF